jgi:hypothetical protein
VRAYLSYHQRGDRLAFWRTSSGLEVDPVVGNMRVALEFKSTKEVRGFDLKGLRALLEEHRPEHLIAMSRVDAPRLTDDGIRILPWETFLGELWDERIV